MYAVFLMGNDFDVTQDLSRKKGLLLLVSWRGARALTQQGLVE